MTEAFSESFNLHEEGDSELDIERREEVPTTLPDLLHESVRHLKTPQSFDRFFPYLQSAWDDIKKRYAHLLEIMSHESSLDPELLFELQTKTLLLEKALQRFETKKTNAFIFQLNEEDVKDLQIQKGLESLAKFRETNIDVHRRRIRGYFHYIALDLLRSLYLLTQDFQSLQEGKISEELREESDVSWDRGTQVLFEKISSSRMSEIITKEKLNELKDGLDLFFEHLGYNRFLNARLVVDRIFQLVNDTTVPPREFSLIRELSGTERELFKIGEDMTRHLYFLFDAAFVRNIGIRAQGVFSQLSDAVEAGLLQKDVMHRFRSAARSVLRRINGMHLEGALHDLLRVREATTFFDSASLQRSVRSFADFLEAFFWQMEREWLTQPESRGRPFLHERKRRDIQDVFSVASWNRVCRWFDVLHRRIKRLGVAFDTEMGELDGLLLECVRAENAKESAADVSGIARRFASGVEVLKSRIRDEEVELMSDLLITHFTRLARVFDEGYFDTSYIEAPVSPVVDIEQLLSQELEKQSPFTQGDYDINDDQGVRQEAVNRRKPFDLLSPNWPLVKVGIRPSSRRKRKSKTIELLAKEKPEIVPVPQIQEVVTPKLAEQPVGEKLAGDSRRLEGREEFVEFQRVSDPKVFERASALFQKLRTSDVIQLVKQLLIVHNAASQGENRFREELDVLEHMSFTSAPSGFIDDLRYLRDLLEIKLLSGIEEKRELFSVATPETEQSSKISETGDLAIFQDSRFRGIYEKHVRKLGLPPQGEAYIARRIKAACEALEDGRRLTAISAINNIKVDQLQLEELPKKRLSEIEDGLVTLRGKIFSAFRI